ncbi:hypothetical protein GPECTOR_14g45 [Gonium pectorale]|uniref:Major facilitator superfamily (MFS) profile domain-containing protein n=1 Tax=Gonium pectorale TaxID=33097 RepID=A0A150GMH5_GONPE|nr:hypothetical protein GPECTOR_14g45 [Gonium pectorale]|eukprot:KXZ51059.1 hypothetical protein GPECTOR_14g45 [Gonium pectorale]
MSKKGVSSSRAHNLAFAQGEFGLTYFEDGLLPALFMVGLLISSPIFAEAVKHANAFRMLGTGMGVWALAVVACGAAPNFGCLLAARAFVGVGEASFVALAAPFIDDFAPPAAKARWFAAFYLCIPVGFAAGYIFGGVVSSFTSWRWAFVAEGLVMLPFIAFALTAQPLSLRGSKPAGRVHHHHSRRGLRAVLREFAADVATVGRQRVWVAVCAAYTAYVAVLGVLAYWGPQAGRALFFGPGSDGEGAGSAANADLVFGGVTVLTGVVGSVAGGVALDRMGSTLRNANLLCAGSNLVGLVLLLIAFNASRSFAAFMGMFAVGQLVIFLLQAPVAAVGMWCVPPELRPLGASLMTVSIHLLGDVPSPPLVGALQSRLAAGKTPHDAAQQWRTSLSICSLLLALSGALFAVAAWLSVPGTDYRGRGESAGEGGGKEVGVGAALAADGPDGEGGTDVRPLLAEEGGARTSSSDVSSS